MLKSSVKNSHNEVFSLILAVFLQIYINSSIFVIELALMESTMSMEGFMAEMAL